MRTIELDNKKYNIPTDWNEITIQNQIDVSNLKDEAKHVRTLAIMAGYTDIPIEVLKNVPMNKVQKVFEHLDFLKDEIPKEKSEEFKFEGETYKLQSDIFNLKTEDFLAIMTAYENYKESPVEAYPVMLAVLYRREGENSLDDYDLDQRYEKFKQLPLPIGYSTYGFFLNNSNALKVLSLISSQANIEYIVREKFSELKTIMKPSALPHGMKWYTRLLIGIMRLYLHYLKKIWEKHYNSSQSENTTNNWWQICKRLRMKKAKRNQNKKEN